MKKIFITAAVVLLLAGNAFTQAWGPQGRGTWPPPAETVSVEGTLQLHNGHIALNSGTTVYYVPRVGRLTGFVDGIREGARVSVEGYAQGNFLHVTKLTIAGRVYDFPALGTGPGFPDGAQGWNRGYAPRGGYHHHGYGNRGGYRGQPRGRW